MADPDHLDIIRKSVQAWNGWRAENRELTPDVSGADFSYEDLSGVDFSGMDLSYENLSSATLVGANLDRTVLDHTDLSDAYLRNATFRRANLNCVNLYGAVLAGADFTDCDLSEGSLKETDLENAVFHNTDLRSTTFTGAEGLTARQVLEARTLRGVIDLDPLVKKQVAIHRPRLLARRKIERGGGFTHPIRLVGVVAPDRRCWPDPKMPAVPDILLDVFHICFNFKVIV